MPVLKFDAESTLQKLQRLARAYAAAEKAGWLDHLEWEFIPVEFPKSLPGILTGTYAAGHIALQQSLSAQALFPAYIHALRLCWLRKTAPLKYFLGKILCPSAVEADARTHATLALAWLQDSRTVLALRHLD